jgi:hypothetical protein
MSVLVRRARESGLQFQRVQRTFETAVAYLAVTLNHFRPIQAWARAVGADARLDMQTFELELKARNRYYVLRPRFLVKNGDRFGHSPELTADVAGFIGWLPYAPLRWPLSNDKLQFKTLLRGAGEPTPDSVEFPASLPHDFVLKRSIGSFGNELAGPFRAGTPAADLAQRLPASGNPAATLYAERFVAGTNVKVWFWGATPFYAHRDGYPAVVGDATASMRELVDARLRSIGVGRPDEPAVDALPAGDRRALESMLAYQQLGWDDVPESGRRVWLDYRYGRRYEVEASSRQSDDALHSFDEPVQSRIAAIGALLSAALKPQFNVPVLYSVDGVLAPDGTLWWLEMNSNPILPPEGYPLIMDSLFGPSNPAPPVSKPADAAAPGQAALA